MELKPCPFCGGEAVSWLNRDYGFPSGDNGWRASVACKNSECGARITHWAAEKKWALDTTVNGWNRRANDV